MNDTQMAKEIAREEATAEMAALAMAEWKDEQHSKEKRQWIEKACEWLKENIHDYYTTGDGGDEFEGWFDDMFEDFRKAMKGE